MTAAGTCKNGHPWNDANTYQHKDGRRSCRFCMRLRNRRRRAAVRSILNADDQPRVELFAPWLGQAACSGQSVLMDDEDRIRDAVKVCLACPVLSDCRAWLSTLEPFGDPGGVCGGWSERERQRSYDRRGLVRDLPAEVAS